MKIVENTNTEDGVTLRGEDVIALLHTLDNFVFSNFIVLGLVRSSRPRPHQEQNLAPYLIT